MITENLSTLKIHKLTKEQYERALSAGNIDERALYLTPDEAIDLSLYATVEQLDTKASAEHKHIVSDISDLQPSLDEVAVKLDNKADKTDIIDVDNTLTISGAAADAMVTGERLAAVGLEATDNGEGVVTLSLGGDGNPELVRLIGQKVSFTEAQTLTEEQKAQARENIGAADESKVNKTLSKLDHAVECKSLGDTIIRSNNPNNFLNSVTTGIGIAVHTDEPIVRVAINTKASAVDNLVCVLESYDGVTEYARDVQPIGTDYADITFNFANTFSGVVRVMFYTENLSRIAIAQYGATPYTSELMYAENGEYCIWLRIAGDDFYTKKLTGAELLQGINFEVFVGIIEYKYVHSMNYIYVSKAGSDTTGDGTQLNPYATIYHANEMIVDNSKDNPYTIIVGQGTYTDLQERYAGTYSGHFEGVNCKDYVYYESENIFRPDLCVIEWDGAVGFTTPVTGEQLEDKCPFHICKNTHTHIKGFTLKCKNTRYCMHIETIGTTVPCEWLMENVIFEWGGRPDQEGAINNACVGTGYCCMEHGVFRNCVFRLTNTSSGNHMIFQSHDNPDNIGNPITVGERLLFQDCFVSVSDGCEYAHFNLRHSKVNPLVKSTATFDNVVGMPIYITENTEGDYGINILGATELKE